jgi:hypothetical protein
MSYPLPTEHERRALFCWLEQASSLTAWQRLSSYHQRFVDVARRIYDAEPRTPGMKQMIEEKELSDLLLGQDVLDAALVRLKGGDRGCFEGQGAGARFSAGLSAASWWDDMYVGCMFGRNGFGPLGSPHLEEFKMRMGQCMLAWSDIGVVLQPNDTDGPAPISDMRAYTSRRGKCLINWWVERKELPAVPLADPEVLIQTGQVVPHYGIWEPVRDPGTLLERLTAGLSGATARHRPLDGCMNYLYGGSAAPTIEFEEDEEPEKGRPTTWRLLWRDDRYGRNPVPAHETNYVFVQPVEGEDRYAYPGTA